MIDVISPAVTSLKTADFLSTSTLRGSGVAAAATAAGPKEPSWIVSIFRLAPLACDISWEPGWSSLPQSYLWGYCCEICNGASKYISLQISTDRSINRSVNCFRLFLDCLGSFWNCFGIVFESFSDCFRTTPFLFKQIKFQLARAGVIFLPENGKENKCRNENETKTNRKKKKQKRKNH